MTAWRWTRGFFGMIAVLLLFPVEAGAATASAPKATPALWKIEKEGATVYLFGSLHILPIGMEWITPEIGAAMEAADVFIFEVPTDEQAAAAEKEFIVKYGLLPQNNSLRNVLTPREFLIYSTVLRRAGLKPEQFARYRPWLAAIILGLAYMNPDRIADITGADNDLLDYATTHGKQIRYLETPESQMALLTGNGDVSAILSLKRLIGSLPSTKAQSQQLLELWSAGDAGSLSARIDSYFTGYTMSKDVFVGNRNREWLVPIRDLLNQSGRTALVTVGAAHIGGLNGLIPLLCEEGYAVERVARDNAANTPACP
jgi:uncharacterized protein YbaP (TraB family)